MYKKPVAIFFSLAAFFSSGFVAGDLQEPPSLMQQKIKYVVILMLENRSFDNVLAWLYDEANPPAQFIPKDNKLEFQGLSEASLDLHTNFLKNTKGDIIFSCSPIKGVPSVSSTKYLNSPKFDPNEPFPNVTTQIFGIDGGVEPTMSGFLQDYGSLWDEDDWLDQQSDICAIMETYTDKELPVTYGLARHYAVSDLWFSSVPTQTNPNRAFTFCGTSDGDTVNGFLGKSTFKSDTVWNRLAEESPTTTWSIFWQSDLLPILYPGPFSGPMTFHSLKRIPNINDYFLKIDTFHALARNGQLPDVSFIEPQWTISLNLSTKEKELLKFVFDSQETLVGLQGNDLHPPGDVRTGENLLQNIYTSLTANKEAWNKTLFIITFDEHGGLFDHVPPPLAISPDDKFQNGFKFDRYGVRVPTIFISPLIDKGTIIRSSNQEVPFDHTSLISTLLTWKNVDKSKWNLGDRVDQAPTFETVITRSNPREDSTVGPEQLPTYTDNVVQMGDLFCLRNPAGIYFCSTPAKGVQFAVAGSGDNKTPLTFGSGSGPMTHGSFATLQSAELTLLETQSSLDCVFGADKHSTSQWWTVKSVDNPFTGAEIHFGDRIYLENHINLDAYQFVPGRLCDQEGLFGGHLKTQPITGSDSESLYWVIERP